MWLYWFHTQAHSLRVLQNMRVCTSMNSFSPYFRKTFSFVKCDVFSFNRQLSLANWLLYLYRLLCIMIFRNLIWPLYFGQLNKNSLLCFYQFSLAVFFYIPIPQKFFSSNIRSQICTGFSCSHPYASCLTTSVLN